MGTHSVESISIGTPHVNRNPNSIGNGTPTPRQHALGTPKPHGLKGKPKSPETREKMRLAKLGKGKRPEQTPSGGHREPPRTLHGGTPAPKGYELLRRSYAVRHRPDMAHIKNYWRPVVLPLDQNFAHKPDDPPCPTVFVDEDVRQFIRELQEAEASKPGEPLELMVIGLDMATNLVYINGFFRITDCDDGGYPAEFVTNCLGKPLDVSLRVGDKVRLVSRSYATFWVESRFKAGLHRDCKYVLDCLTYKFDSERE